MKLAIIHSIYKPYSRGGAEVVVENIANGFKKNGNDVLVIALGYKNEIKEVDGVKVYYIKPFNLFNFLDINSKPAWFRLPWHIIDMINDVQTWRIYKILKQENPDLVLTHNLKGLGYYIPWLLKIMKLRHIHTIHDMQLIHPSGLLQKNQKLNLVVSFYAWLNKKLFNKVEKVIFPSNYIKTAYESYGFFASADKLVVANPVEIHDYDFKPKCKNSQNPQLLFLGQVEEYKGILDLIAATKKIKINFTLHIVGDGSALAKAKDLVTNDLRFKFYGRLSQAELKNNIWSKIDLLINPTKVPESFGLVVAEAFSYGIPVLASDIGAIPELIDDGKNGWLFKPGDIDELSYKIKSITGSICAYESIGLLGHQKVKDMSIDHYLNKLEEFAKITSS